MVILLNAGSSSMLGLAKELKKSFSTLYPYFQKENKVKNWLLLAAYSGANVLQAGVVMFLFSYMSVFMGMFALPTVTYQLFFSTLLDFTGTLFVYGAAQAAKYLATQSLELSLMQSLNKDLRTRWLDARKHAYFGVHLQGIKVYPNKVLRDDIQDIVKQTFKLLDIGLSTFFGFFIGMYRLFAMSSLLAFTIMGREIAVPGLMAIGSVIYALGYNFLSSKMSAPLPELTRNRKNADGHLQNVISHIDSNGAAIALQKTANSEKKFYEEAVNNLDKLSSEELKVSTALKFIKKVHEYLSMAVGLVMAAPSIIAQKVQATEVLEINHYFTDIIGFFTATQENIKPITRLDTAVNRVDAFKKALDDWDVAKNAHHCPDYDQKTFSVKALTIRTPDGRLLVNNSSINFKLDKVTLLEGKTGAGKSTIIKAIAGIWPYAEGKCSMPTNEEQVHIVPQKPCLPYQSSLLEAITYVLNKAQRKEVSVDKIKIMMKELGLDEQIQDLNTVKCWSQELSGGEMQRIAIISAALKKPKVLILDESMSALDVATKGITQAFVKKHIKATTLMIDHQPDAVKGQTPFYDSIVKLKNQKLTNVKQIELTSRKKALMAI